MIITMAFGQNDDDHDEYGDQNCHLTINGTKNCDSDHNETFVHIGGLGTYPPMNINVWETKQNQSSLTFIVWIGFVIMLSIFIFFSIYLLYVPRKDTSSPHRKNRYKNNQGKTLNTMDTTVYSKKLAMFNPNIVRTSIRHSDIHGITEFGSTTSESIQSFKSNEDNISMKRQQQQQQYQQMDHGPIRSPPDFGQDHQQFYNSLGGGFIVRHDLNKQQQQQQQQQQQFPLVKKISEQQN
ncbi:hypothetical protein DERF_002352 [Dermatophagoides farinae]|uniref:Uncharacterized protein n=1 Tax=Dermatophagoides farinae TaxID=6954 RepID=A0A922LBX2_DERFA|nr:hypothetical protein DERF_002352 [Dermatophagoides farinae]